MPQTQQQKRYFGNYECLGNISSEDIQLIILRGTNAIEITSHLSTKIPDTNDPTTRREIIPLYDHKGNPSTFHVEDCTTEISEDEKQGVTYIIITNKDPEKRKIARGELEKSLAVGSTQKRTGETQK